MADPWNRLGGDDSDSGVPPRPFDRSALEATLADAVRTADPAVAPAADGMNKAVASLLRAGGVGRIGSAPPAAGGGLGGSADAAGLGAGAGEGSAAGALGVPGVPTGPPRGSTPRPASPASSALGTPRPASPASSGLGTPRPASPAGTALAAPSGSARGLSSSIGRIGASGAGLGQAAYAGDNRVSVDNVSGRAVSPLSPAPTEVERATIPLRRTKPPAPAGPANKDGAAGKGAPAGEAPVSPASGPGSSTASAPGPGGPTAPARALVSIEPWSPADDDMLPRGQIKKKSFSFVR
jgi:hypothetical protein